MPGRASVTSEVESGTSVTPYLPSPLRTAAPKPVEEEPAPTPTPELHPSVIVEIFKLLVLRCPPRVGEAKALTHRSLGRQLDTIARFFEDAAVFVLSRMWFDVLAGYLLRLHAVSYCGDFLATECVPEASAWVQLLFALAIVPLTAMLKHLVEYFGITDRPGFNQVPMMLKACPSPP